MHSSIPTVMERRSSRANRPRRVDFPEGLIGCESWRSFELRVEPEQPMISVLQCLDDPEACFLLVDPFNLIPDYRVRLTASDREFLRLGDVEEPAVFCTLTVNEDEGMITANLLGPLAINKRTGLGRQLVQSATDYSARHRVGSYVREVQDAGSDAQGG
ncbi:MAG: flagellar assembly protein FliW [Chloroflexota bacterium]|nr:MAG: flagellar assembly protein FliW [Chloroflexota bacterium]